MAKDGNPIFAVRLRQELHDRIRQAAKDAGLGVAQWVERALAPSLEEGAGDPSIMALERRVAALEAIAKVRLSSPTPKTASSAPKLSRSKGTASAPTSNGEWVKIQGKRKMLTSAGVEEVLRRHAAGESHRSIGRVVDVSGTAIAKLIKSKGAA